jgi:hypothetical protein
VSVFQRPRPVYVKDRDALEQMYDLVFTPHLRCAVVESREPVAGKAQPKHALLLARGVVSLAGGRVIAERAQGKYLITRLTSFGDTSTRLGKPRLVAFTGGRRRRISGRSRPSRTVLRTSGDQSPLVAVAAVIGPFHGSGDAQSPWVVRDARFARHRRMGEVYRRVQPALLQLRPEARRLIAPPLLLTSLLLTLYARLCRDRVGHRDRDRVDGLEQWGGRGGRPGGERLKTGGLVLDSRDFDHPATDADLRET